MRVKPAILLCFIILFIGVSITCHAQGNTATAGGSSNNIIYPLPGEPITERQPMITVRLPELDPPIDVDTIRIIFDGDDVTSETQIGGDYIFFEPSMPLSFDAHNVIISYDDTAGTSQPALSWSFRVVVKAAKTQVAKPQVQEQQGFTTTGRYTIKSKVIDLNEATRVSGGTTWNSNDIKYQEGMDNTGTFDFTHKGYGKTIVGHYDRSVEQITGRANDRFYFTFQDEDDKVTVGDYYIRGTEFSPLTINGVQMRGFKKERSYGKHDITTFGGRSQEPHDGRLKRMTWGLKVDTNTSHNHNLRFMALKSTKQNLTNLTTKSPTKDDLLGLKSDFQYNTTLKLESEYVFNKHRQENPNSTSDSSGNDNAVRVSMKYDDNSLFMQVGRRSVGPRFSPTVLGTFTEVDREGNFVNVSYIRPSRKLSASYSYDIYHDNVHKQQEDTITDKTKTYRSSLALNYGGPIPRIDLSYSELSTESDAKKAEPGYKWRETKTMSLRLTKPFKNTKIFTGTRLAFALMRMDNNNLTYSYPAGSSSRTEVRSDTSTWNFATRVTSLMQINLSTAMNKSFTNSISSSVTSHTKTNTDSAGVMFNIIPFKFITSVNYRRQGRKTRSSNLTYFSAAPLEYQHSITMVYYLNSKEKIQFEFINYDKEYRSVTNIGRGYDEQSMELGYTTEF